MDNQGRTEENLTDLMDKATMYEVAKEIPESQKRQDRQFRVVLFVLQQFASFLGVPADRFRSWLEEAEKTNGRLL